MWRRVAIVLTFCLLVSGTISRAQLSELSENLIAELVEKASRSRNGTIPVSQLVDELVELVENPINLNSADYSDLKRIFFLSEFQIRSLIDYRDSTGMFMSIYEVRLVPGFDLVDLRHLQPFVTVKPVTSPVELRSFLYGRSELSISTRTLLRKPVGYYGDSITGGYSGSDCSLKMRYRYRSGNRFAFGLTAAKDPGEPFLDGTFPVGIDYLSGYAFVRDIGHIKRLVVGDFHAEYGQGLTFWNGLAFGVMGSSCMVAKRGRGLVQHSSAYEADYLRGVGVAFRFRSIDVSLFASARRIDAHVVDTLSGGCRLYSSLPASGYHRTVSEITNRKALSEYVAGINMQLRTRKTVFGAVMVRSAIDGVVLIPQRVYLQPSVRSRRSAAGFYVNSYLGGNELFGEVSFERIPGTDDFSAPAFIMGSRLILAPGVSFALLLRRYPKTYNARYSAAMAQGSMASNEEGGYAAISLSLAKSCKVDAAIDLFRYPGARYRIGLPSTGREVMLRSEWCLSPRMAFSVRFCRKDGQLNMSESNLSVKPVLDYHRESVRMKLELNPTDRIRLQTTLSGSSYANDSLAAEYGFMLAQDVSVNLARVPVSFSMRLAMFDTPSWKSRIYSYENDMLYSFSVPAYYAEGLRCFILAKWRIDRNASLWIRYAVTRYADAQSIGTGLDRIDGNIRNELKAMVRIRF